MMAAVRTSETSVYFNETTSPYSPEGYNLQRGKRLKISGSHGGEYEDYSLMGKSCVQSR
jgi:hypothetical protein